ELPRWRDRLCHRGRQYPDEHTRAVHLPPVRPAGDDRQPQHRRAGHSVPVAGHAVRQPLLAFLQGAADRPQRTGRSLWARRYAHHRAEGPQAEDGRGLRPQGPPGVPGHRGGYQRARVPDADPGWRDARHVAEQDGADLSMRHIISLLLENEPGARSRVVGLFAQRNYNIESLTVAPTEDPTLSRLTLTTIGHEEVIEQITKNLNKLIEVVKLVDLSESAHIERELMLVKV